MVYAAPDTPLCQRGSRECDDVGHFFGMRDKSRVAGRNRSRGGTHPPGKKFLRGQRNHVVIGA